MSLDINNKWLHDFCVRIFLVNGHSFNVVVTATDKAGAYDKASCQTSMPIARFKLMWESETQFDYEGIVPHNFIESPELVGDKSELVLK